MRPLKRSSTPPAATSPPRVELGPLAAKALALCRQADAMFKGVVAMREAAEKAGIDLTEDDHDFTHTLETLRDAQTFLGSIAWQFDADELEAAHG